VGRQRAAREGEYLTRRELLSGSNVQEGRALLREVLEGPIRFTPDARTYRFDGLLSFRKALAGVVPCSLATDLVDQNSVVGTRSQNG